MKNRKGFTVVELIASFALTMIISVFLFEVLLEVKDVFVETTIKTSIQQKVGIISKNIKRNLPNTEMTCSSNSCSVASTNIITVNETNVRIGSQTINTPNVGGAQVKIENTQLEAPCIGDNCMLKVSFKMNHPNLKKPYDYSVVYYYPRF